jgi:hypothetical protein
MFILESEDKRAKWSRRGPFHKGWMVYGPLLRVHLFDEAGALRQHVQIFVNGTDSRHLPSLQVPVADGDEIIVLQAISGGAPSRFPLTT